MRGKLEKLMPFWTLGYLPLYLRWFFYLEENTSLNYHIMHVRLDDLIPFCEWFIIPYLMWFFYIAAAYLWLLFHDRKDFYRYCLFLFGGMSIALLICTVFPNGTDLRVPAPPSGNILCRLVGLVQRLDTQTNVFPSIHVYNSIATHLALSRDRILRKHPAVMRASALLTVLICISTVTLKQHSVIDVMGAVVLVAVMYGFVYREAAVFVSSKGEENLIHHIASGKTQQAKNGGM